MSVESGCLRPSYLYITIHLDYLYPFVLSVLCSVCTLLCLYFVPSVLCSVCTLFSLYFVLFVLCSVWTFSACTLLCLYFVPSVLRSACAFILPLLCYACTLFCLCFVLYVLCSVCLSRLPVKCLTAVSTDPVNVDTFPSVVSFLSYSYLRFLYYCSGRLGEP